MTHKHLKQLVYFVALIAFCTLVLWLRPQSTVAQSDSSLKTVTVSPEAANQPLTLVWQTGVNHDDALLGAWFIGVDDDGNAYATNTSGDAAKRFDSNGTVTGKFGERGTGDGQFNIGAGVAVAAQGNVYIIDASDTPRVEKFDSDGNFLTAWPTAPLTGPSAIGVDSTGNVYVSNWHNPQGAERYNVGKFDSAGKFLGGWAVRGSTGPHVLAMDSQDHVYLPDISNHSIQEYDSDGNLVNEIVTSEPWLGMGNRINAVGLGVDDAGNVYLNDGQFLNKIDPDGNLLAQWSITHETGSDLDGATYIAVDGPGNIYVVARGIVTNVKGEEFNIYVLKKFKQS